jgi:PEP-CTERM motif
VHLSFVERTTILLMMSGGLGLSGATSAAAADPTEGNIYGNALYDQTSNNQPTAAVGDFFDIGTFFATPDDYTSAAAIYPGARSPLSLPVVSTTDLNYGSSLYSMLADLHADFPFGTYTIAATGPAGPSTTTIHYTADYFGSAVPYLTDFSSLAGLNPLHSFTVDFNSFTPNPRVSEAFTFFTVYNFNTGVPVYSQGFLSPSATSVVIPGGVLSPGTKYGFELDFSDRLNGAYDPIGNSYSEQGFDLRTDGSFTTGAFTTRASVPEPSTWAMMLLGFAGLGCSGYLRARASRTMLTAYGQGDPRHV